MEARKFRKVMAANRGEIAIRIFRACTELGISTVAIYSEEDKLSLHRYKADEAYQVGKGKAPIDAYLGIDEIIALAKKREVDAIHPGYGFLAENAEFAEKCEQNGIAFIGPTAEMQRALGDKVAARKVAKAAGVATVPGTEEPIVHEEEALIFAKNHGYPIIIKAAAGGGGRGMRVATNQKELLEGLQSASSEAKASFGDPSVFLERYLKNPKHIEVQVLGDGYGSLVHFYERDCSIQRRHQKVVEFAPSLALPGDTRLALCTDALKIAKQVGYRNAGTVEFLLDEEGRYYFIEMNPRIQVEHTVTEMITGRNLVQAQILIAEGKRLSDPEINIPNQGSIEMRGFAIQCRITTEDPTNNFAPDFGTLTTYRSSAGCGVRLDAGNAFTGAQITPHYDSLLVKVSAWGLTFTEAAHIMDRSLQEFRVRGVKTNIGFLENVITHPVFLAGECNTSFIDQHPELLVIPEKKDRANKVLNFLGDVIVNGSPGVAKPLRSADLIEAAVPQIDLFAQKPKGTKDILREKGAEGLAKWVLEQKKLLLTDTTMRDAHQSLLATRVRTYDLLKVADATSHLASDLFSLELWGGATFDVSMRFLKEDPWQRLHALSETIPNVLFQMLLRGSNAVGYTNYPDNVVQRFVAQAAESGVDVFRVFDSLNWTRGMQVAMEAVQKSGKICEAAICYTGDISDPTRTKYPLSYYVSMAKELEKMGAHILAIKDMAGLLKPYAGYQLVKALKEEIGIPVHLHTHDTSGNGGALLLMAAQAGVDIVDAALSSISGLTSQPNLNALVATLKGTEFDPQVNERGLQQLANYWETVRDYYAPFESGLKSGTAEVYHHEIPGGQYSNYKPQVAGLGLIERWEECKEMYHKVNLLFGDVVKVTPSSKVVGDMAMFLVKNNLEPEDVFAPDADLAFPESVVGFFKGMIGQPYQGFPKELQKIILKGQEPITCRPGELLEPADFERERAAAEAKVGHPVNDEELMSYMMYPSVYVEYAKHRQEFSDVSVIPTPIFFYGLEPGQETSIELQPGKTLIVKLNAIGKTQPDGTKKIYFELNGNARSVTVRDQSVQSDEAGHEKADKSNPKHVGAPMPGKVIKLNVKVGDAVKAGDILAVTEAMKMETNIKAKEDGTVAEVKCKEGGKVEKEELLFVMA
ncbi:pyruvate carboxylase [Geomonas sp. Red69]|uniref:Pyruvate carboxylase n=1 Tax=Geomonas diazotrophica TaxID=2843197 RepID=A0ABX8JM57_9BACT|nr:MULTISPECIES: pyruvate carboxylase [Geomonas]MBU5635240.1 pyruvate carboxylase [Geomonas diazotrophica]QWV97704.1 pyruvate carboxylase [Geomonas nitrogeniifigens]QXE86840.1 pyruvate carboxylase [Geomonas nitrogeniifigens]